MYLASGGKRLCLHFEVTIASLVLFWNIFFLMCISICYVDEICAQKLPVVFFSTKLFRSMVCIIELWPCPPA